MGFGTRSAAFGNRMNDAVNALSGKKLAIILAMGFGLSACQSSGLNGATEGLSSTNNTQQITLSPDPKGEVFGQGQTRITLLVPKTAPGNAASIANEIRNGALLALQDFGQNTIQLVIKDTKGQAADAQGATSEAVAEGSTAIVGPLFSSSVSAASGIAVPAGRTMIAFSNDVSVARRGVYLLSYTQQADTIRMMNYALSLGKRNIHAFLSNNAIGGLQETVLRQLSGGAGANINITKYELSGPRIETAVREAAVAITAADAIYIPEGGQIPGAILSGLKRAGVELANKQVLGSGQWESVKFDKPELEGALYTGRDITNFNAFASRYQTTYNTQPGVFAALGYDSITLVSSLISSKGATGAFQPTAIEDRRGFAGINGIFRFKADGTAERGLAVYKVTGGAGRPASPAPTSFSGS
jgi:ABC-type branched-subunit amino acid transport system substrate-binding protein